MSQLGVVLQRHDYQVLHLRLAAVRAVILVSPLSGPLGLVPAVILFSLISCMHGVQTAEQYPEFLNVYSGPCP